MLGSMADLQVQECSFLEPEEEAKRKSVTMTSFSCFCVLLFTETYEQEVPPVVAPSLDLTLPLVPGNDTSTISSESTSPFSPSTLTHHHTVPTHI